jgi:hypothetical protein
VKATQSEEIDENDEEKEREREQRSKWIPSKACSKAAINSFGSECEPEKE